MKIQRSTALAVLAAALLVGAAHAEPRGARFLYGMKTNNDVAALVESHRLIDPTGTSLLTPEKCATPHDRSCASEHDIFVFILNKDPDAMVNGVLLREHQELLPDFLRSLRMEIPPDGEYYMACELPSSKSPSGWTPKEECVVRIFAQGEKAYVDQNNGIVLFAQECNNPVGRPFKPPPKRNPCIEIDYTTDSNFNDWEVHFKEFAKTDLANDRECPAMLLRAGETTWETAFIEHCSNEDCNFAGAEAIVAGTGSQGWQSGSHRVSPGRGINRLRISRRFAEQSEDARVFFCLLRSDGTQSCGIGVEWLDYQIVKSTKVATIQYSEDDSLRAHQLTSIGTAVQLWWDFTHLMCPW